MKTIKFFHPEETFTYFVSKCFCKVVYSGKKHHLFIEIFSTDDLDHVEEDAIQNSFPEVAISVDDLVVDVQNVGELGGKTFEIPFSFEELEDEEGEVEEVYYTTFNFSDELFESDGNQLRFFKNEANQLCLNWKGEVQDFTQESDQLIPFELECCFSEQNLNDKD